MQTGFRIGGGVGDLRVCEGLQLPPAAFLVEEFPPEGNMRQVMQGVLMNNGNDEVLLEDAQNARVRLFTDS